MVFLNPDPKISLDSEMPRGGIRRWYPLTSEHLQSMVCLSINAKCSFNWDPKHLRRIVGKPAKQSFTRMLCVLLGVLVPPPPQGGTGLPVQPVGSPELLWSPLIKQTTFFFFLQFPVLNSGLQNPVYTSFWSLVSTFSTRVLRLLIEFYD